jgi:predicted GNAT superfamily acetyltransferase
MGAAEEQPDVRPLDAMPDIERAVALLAEIWGEPGPMSPEMLRALGHAGGYTAGAWIAGELVGVSAGFLARHGGELLLHSHISGVRRDRQGANVGYALKQHQRAWARAQGIKTIEWTFDPISRRNAYFNLGKLGACIVGYERDFYGTMRDAINSGEPSDRAIVRWHLGAVIWSLPRGSRPSTVLAADDDGRPVRSPIDGPILRAWIPEDHAAMRVTEPDLARQWRHAVRETFELAMQAKYVAVGMTRDGWYTLHEGQP